MPLWSRVRAFFEASGVLTLLDALRCEGGPPESRVAFTIAVVALGAKMAGVDGRATDPERRAFAEAFQVSPEDAPGVERFFAQAQSDPAGYEIYARRIADMFAGRPEMLEEVLAGLFHIALSDGALDARESAFLEQVADVFGLEAAARRRILRQDESGAACAYATLGLQRGASFEAVREAWARLARDNHPDRLVGKGLPPEAVRIAAERLSAVNAAYEALKPTRLETAR